ncbi:MAG TPA: zf-HC2 domain-containing protein [Pyrinomonadaceae bacterium]|nr:zf-HC2 domain-containing protein [Pyrinomonadaceae bacterium]
MNCEQCQELIQDFVDGSLSQRDEFTLNTHLKDCLDCESVRQDLTSILSFCQTHRGEYEAPPNEQALWLRIRNVIEAENGHHVAVQTDVRQPSFLGRLMGRSWELSLPQLASLTAAIVLLVSLTTVVGLRRLTGTEGGRPVPVVEASNSNINDRIFERTQVINYWNQRIEMSKARWSPKMREGFDDSMRKIDEAVTNSLNELNRDPHDEVSEQMLNAALNKKLELLRDFSDL